VSVCVEPLFGGPSLLKKVPLEAGVESRACDLGDLGFRRSLSRPGSNPGPVI
jgi:hypothetical protein